MSYEQLRKRLNEQPSSEGENIADRIRAGLIILQQSQEIERLKGQVVRAERENRWLVDMLNNREAMIKEGQDNGDPRRYAPRIP